RLDPGRLTRRALRADVERVVSALRALARSNARWVALPLALLLAASCLRASVAPPLAWDALTYHLVKAARWGAGAGLYADDAPDAWGYYRWFSWVPEVPWAWALLPLSSDLALGAVNIAIALATLIAARALARELGADEPTALLVAGVVLCAP